MAAPPAAPAFWWDNARDLQILPGSLLWEVPLANQREPRTAIRYTSYHDNELLSSTLDAAVGGQFGLFRIPSPLYPGEGFQLDIFAATFTRLNQALDLMATDYRFGFPLTWRCGQLQVKFGYEHTSCHAGDEYLLITGNPRNAYVRDEVVLALAYRFCNEVRIYGQFGYALGDHPSLNGVHTRYDWGVEWEMQRTTGFWGQPFAAFDMDLRAEQDFTPNLTLQVGWQWLNLESQRSIRLALELYTGKSPYGQFLQQSQSWIGGAVLYDW